jgi:hypothetical protein
MHPLPAVRRWAEAGKRQSGTLNQGAAFFLTRDSTGCGAFPLASAARYFINSAGVRAPSREEI